jgi:hypothetical protein
VRSPDRYKEAFGGPNPNLDVVKGDVADIDSLRTVLAGGSGVIFAASAAAYKDPPLVDFMVCVLVFGNNCSESSMINKQTSCTL